MAGFLKQKLLQELCKNGEELTRQDISSCFKRFRLSNKDIAPLFDELEKDGFIEMINTKGNRFKRGIKVKISKNLRL